MWYEIWKKTPFFPFAWLSLNIVTSTLFSWTQSVILPSVWLDVIWWTMFRDRDRKEWSKKSCFIQKRKGMDLIFYLCIRGEGWRTWHLFFLEYWDERRKEENRRKECTRMYKYSLDSPSRAEEDGPSTSLSVVVSSSSSSSSSSPSTSSSHDDEKPLLKRSLSIRRTVFLMAIEYEVSSSWEERLLLLMTCPSDNLTAKQDEDIGIRPDDPSTGGDVGYLEAANILAEDGIDVTLSLPAIDDDDSTPGGHVVLLVTSEDLLLMICCELSPSRTSACSSDAAVMGEADTDDTMDVVVLRLMISMKETKRKEIKRMVSVTIHISMWRSVELEGKAIFPEEDHPFPLKFGYLSHHPYPVYSLISLCLWSSWRQEEWCTLKKKWMKCQ